MTSKVFVRFVNEKQWHSLCAMDWQDEPIAVPDELTVEWCIVGDGGHLTSPTESSFAEFVDLIHQRYEHSYLFGITLIISGINVVTTQVNIPSKQTRHIAQAIPYMIEDQVSQDVSKLHLIMGARDSEGNVPVLAVPHQLMEGTCNLFEQFDLPLDSVLADMLCLPLQEAEWTFLIDGRFFLIKKGPFSGMSIEMDAAPVVLGSIVEHWPDKPHTVRVILCEERFNQNLKNWLKTQISSSLADVDVALEYDEVAGSEFEVLCDQLNQSLPAKKIPHDFMQGKYGVSSRRRRPSLFNWKPLAALIATFLVLHTGYLYTQAAKIDQEAERLDMEAKALYKQLFPRDQRIVNIKRQMEQHINDYMSGSGGDDFMVLLTMTGKEMNTINKSTKDAIQPRRVAYEEGQGDLRLDLVVKDFTQLEAFKTRLEKASLAVETAQATQDDDVVKARLKIRNQRS